MSSASDGHAAMLAAEVNRLLPEVSKLVPDSGDGGLVLSAGATATAVGENTFASTAVDATVAMRGLITFAFGRATATATANSPTGETAFGVAETFVDVAGADLLLTATHYASGNGGGSRNWWSETSTTTFLAIDVAGLSPQGGPVAGRFDTEATLTKPPLIPAANVALFDTDVLVLGQKTLADVQVEALALEDQLSTSTIQVLAALEEDKSTEADCLLIGTSKSERISTGAGDDWVIAGKGHDSVNLGEGHNTAFGQGGHDWLHACTGDDWLFGGTGNDVLMDDAGENILYGGVGNDSIFGGSDADWIRDGAGRDEVRAGEGDDTLLLGHGNRSSDGNDCYWAGGGGDWFVMSGAFGRDTVHGFNLAEGDRLIAGKGDWDSDAGLRALNGTAVVLQREYDDLLVTIRHTGGTSRLTLDDFFDLNTAYSGTVMGTLSDSKALPILRELFIDADTQAGFAERMRPFEMGDALSLLG